ncbi:hypothetical protein QTI33_31745 [Variovorax sp. J22P271]|uniref:hypothetical protein n=1 Tax=Variovorax davisae TaxID=3053515 RepID=UPI002574E053|nr:hypothetical protein [Variovorax sp. J22P271]MDM0036746.1 hypothetical protein [Variovorax sp. J22P271]
MKALAASLFAISCLLVGGCNASGNAEKFVGNWHRVKYPQETLTVSHEGRGRLVFEAHDYTSGAPAIGQLSGDQVQFGGLVSAQSIAALRENGNLIYFGREYTR